LKNIIYLLFIFFSFSNFNVFSRGNNINNIDDLFFNKISFSFQYGGLMSGIKKEDFVKSNYSPVYRLSIIKNLNKKLEARIGYQGNFFLLISDDLIHKYDFYFFDYILNVNNLFFKSNNVNTFNIHLGSGLLYNHFYQGFNFCGTLGFMQKVYLNSSFTFILDFTSVLGWDIYQGDEDILPSLSFGLIYYL